MTRAATPVEELDLARAKVLHVLEVAAERVYELELERDAALAALSRVAALVRESRWSPGDPPRVLMSDLVAALAGGDPA